MFFVADGLIGTSPGCTRDCGSRSRAAKSRGILLPPKGCGALLNEERECVLYTVRPITCRIYGVPTKVRGKARVCGLSGFEQGVSYPAFDLDGVFRDLYDMSRELVEKEGGEEPERAGLLVSVSKALTTPLESLVHEPLEESGEAP